MKLLYFITEFDPLRGSSVPHAHFLRALERHGIEPVVLTLNPSLRSGSSLSERNTDGFRRIEIACSRSAGARARNRLSRGIFHDPFFWNAWLGYRRVVHSSSIDVVHSVMAYPLGAIAAAGNGSPLLLCPQGEDLIVEPRYDYGHRRFFVPRTLVRRALRRAAVIRCLAPMVVDLVRNCVGEVDRCEVVPLNIREDAVPEDVEAHRRKATRLRGSLLGAERSCPLVLSFGRLHPFKGLDTLVSALGVLGRRGFDFEAVFVGAPKITPAFGNYREYLNSLVREEGIADRVRFLDAVPGETAAQVLAAADAVVVPSTTESFNRVTIEAAAVGTPVVVTRSTGISAYLEGEKWAVVAERREPESMATDIERALELGREARIHGPAFARQFLPEMVAARMIPLYERTLRARG